MLGEIPDDPAMTRAVRSYLPVVEFEPTAPASLALEQAAQKLARHHYLSCHRTCPVRGSGARTGRLTRSALSGPLFLPANVPLAPEECDE